MQLVHALQLVVAGKQANGGRHTRGSGVYRYHLIGRLSIVRMLVNKRCGIVS